MITLPAWAWRTLTVAACLIVAPLFFVYVRAVDYYTYPMVMKRNLDEAHNAAAVDSILADGSITAYDKMKEAMEGPGAQYFLSWRALNKSAALPTIVQPFDTKTSEKAIVSKVSK